MRENIERSQLLRVCWTLKRCANWLNVADSTILMFVLVLLIWNQYSRNKLRLIHFYRFPILIFRVSVEQFGSFASNLLIFRIRLINFVFYREWLLRDSESRKGTMSIDYFCAGRVRHVQIKVAMYTDPYTNGKVHVVTTDMDQAFYNVHSLIEFYRLNLGKNFRCM